MSFLMISLEAKIFWNKLLRFIISNYVGAMPNPFFIWLHAYAACCAPPPCILMILFLSKDEKKFIIFIFIFMLG